MRRLRRPGPRGKASWGWRRARGSSPVERRVVSGAGLRAGNAGGAGGARLGEGLRERRGAWVEEGGASCDLP